MIKGHTINLYILKENKEKKLVEILKRKHYKIPRETLTKKTSMEFSTIICSKSYLTYK
jgi:hypothetical protein